MLMEAQRRINIQNELVNSDISTYIYERLRFDPSLKRWRKDPKVQEEIRSTLTEKADGVYFWTDR